MKKCVKVYRSIHGDTPQEVAADAKKAVAEGYTVIKTSPTDPTHYVDTLKSVEKLVEKVGAIREAIGNEVDMAIDFHVIVSYGVSICAVADNLIESVKYKVEAFTGMEVDKINIYVEGVRVID